MGNEGWNKKLISREKKFKLRPSDADFFDKKWVLNKHDFTEAKLHDLYLLVLLNPCVLSFLRLKPHGTFLNRKISSFGPPWGRTTDRLEKRKKIERLGIVKLVNFCSRRLPFGIFMPRQFAVAPKRSAQFFSPPNVPDGRTKKSEIGIKRIGDGPDQSTSTITIFRSRDFRSE